MRRPELTASTRALSVLQWLGFLGGASTWTAQHVLGYGIAEARCSVGGAGWGIRLATWEGALLGCAVVLVLCAEAAALTAETLAVLAHPAFAPAFAANARAEVAIVADLPELGDGARINGRIDRLAVTDGEVLAVDYKTNRPPPATSTSTAAARPSTYRSPRTQPEARSSALGNRAGMLTVWLLNPRDTVKKGFRMK